MSQTRRPRGTRIADDVHRALRIRAAETGETQENIVDLALRKELGMVTKTFEQWKISHHILGGNVFDGIEWEGQNVDEPASVAKLADMTGEALEKAFPGATVEITYEVNVSGGDGRDLYVIDTADDHIRYEPGESGEGGRIATEASDITGQVWESWAWIVYYDGSSR